MSKIYSLSEIERIMEEASLWLAKMDRGLDEEEREQLQVWMVADSRHYEALCRMANDWDRLDSLSHLAEMFPRGNAKNPKPLTNFATYSVSIILGFLLSASLAFNWFSFGKETTTVGVMQHETGVGESIAVVLPDGSQALLNTNSRISVNYTDTQRHIGLIRGEALFTVAKDEDRAFVVHAGDNLIQAVGTAFNVKIKPDNVVALTVTEGRVFIGAAVPSEGLENGANLSTTINLQDAASIGKGKSALLAAGTITVEVTPEDQIKASLAWRNGSLIFQGESLEEAIREISRYTTVTFEITDERLKTLRIAGVFKTGDIPGLLLSLRDNFDITVKKLSEQHIQLSAGTNTEQHEQMSI